MLGKEEILDLKMRQAYSQHKYYSKTRGIRFNLTLDEWKAVWVESGHFNDRGKGKGKYVMARKGPDIGPYEVGNVIIKLATDNTSEFIRDDSFKKRMSEARKGKPSHAKKSKEEIKEMMKKLRYFNLLKRRVKSEDSKVIPPVAK